MSEKIEELVKALTPAEKDMLYRHLWKQYVLEDMYSLEPAISDEMLDEILDYAADLYVYEGEYDCNLSYWNNIENVIEMAIERKC